MKNPIAIGADIGGTHIACAAVDIAEGVLLENTHSREEYNHEASAGLILHRWAAALNRTLSKMEALQPLGIGFAIPGPFDYRNGVSRMQHKFKSLYDVNIPAALSDLLSAEKKLPMRFLNDATSFAVGEAWRGEGRNHRKVVVITLGTGFGSAFLDHGVPVVSGKHVPKEGCLWHLPFRDGIADDYFSTRWFTGAYLKQTGKSVSGVKELIGKTAGDPVAKDLFRQFGRHLAECLAPWLKLFEAEILIAGGNIAHALPLFEADFQEGIHKAGISIHLAPSHLMENAALMGSARLMDEVFWSKVSAELPHI